MLLPTIPRRTVEMTSTEHSRTTSVYSATSLLPPRPMSLTTKRSKKHRLYRRWFSTKREVESLQSGKSLWSGSEAAPTYLVEGEKHVVINVSGEPLAEGFTPSHLARRKLELAE